MKTALYIGRFQPFHNGHLDAIYQIKKSGFDKVIIGIGSSNEKRTNHNPFSYQERVDMINRTLKSVNLIEYNVLPIPDFGNDILWTNYILDNSPKFEAVFSGNEWTRNCFKKHSNKDVLELKLEKEVCATMIREKIRNKDNTWKEYINSKVLQYLEFDKNFIQEVFGL